MMVSHIDDEGEDWLRDFEKKVSTPNEEEEAFFERRRRLGLGVGLSSDGKIIRACDVPSGKEEHEQEPRG